MSSRRNIQRLALLVGWLAGSAIAAAQDGPIFALGGVEQAAESTAGATPALDGAIQPLSYIDRDFTSDARWLDGASFFVGLDGSKQPQDFGINAHFGGRFGGNVGLPLWRDAGIGLQLGAACNFSDNAVHVMQVADGADHRNQAFLTAGIFQRTEANITWAAGYDVLWQDYYDTFVLSQWRGSLGYQLDEQNEIGVWGAVHDREDRGRLAGATARLQGINQVSGYWRHLWPFRAETACWLGISDGHGEEVLVFPAKGGVDHAVLFGSSLDIPLSDHVSLTGQANFLLPADTGTVDAFLGFAWYPGGTPRTLSRSQFAPVLPVANNPYFSVDLRR